MILVDTSIWADHIGRAVPTLTLLLDRDGVLMHPFVLGELALGNLRDRGVIETLNSLPQVHMAFDREVLMFIERHALFGTGIGYVDAHLLAAARLADDAQLWTRDRRLHAAAVRLGVAWQGS